MERHQDGHQRDFELKIRQDQSGDEKFVKDLFPKVTKQNTRLPTEREGDVLVGAAGAELESVAAPGQGRGSVPVLGIGLHRWDRTNRRQDPIFVSANLPGLVDNY